MAYRVSLLCEMHRGIAATRKWPSGGWLRGHMSGLCSGEGSLDIDPSYLSFEQALADYVVLIAHLKQTLASAHSPVIAFGGSYGGMLAAWLRLKYPLSVVVRRFSYAVKIPTVCCGEAFFICG